MTQDLIDPNEAAKILGVSARWIRELLKNGKLEGQKIGIQWVTTLDAVEAYKAKQDTEQKK